MLEINYIDKTFNPQSSGSYEISLQANQNGLAYCIFDPSSNSFIVFRKHRFEYVVSTGDLIRKVQAVLENDDFLSFKFHKVLFLGFSQHATLVPESFFDRDEMAEYLYFNLGEQTDHAFFNNPVNPPGLFNVFALPEALVSQITLHFKKVEFLNQTTPFLRHIANQTAAFINPSVYMSLNPGFFDIACVGYGKLILYNTFQYVNENDLLYYTLFALKQVGFAPEKIVVKLSGEFSTRSSYFEMIRQYIPETVMDDAVCMPLLAPGLKALSVPRFLNLLNLQMCVSSGESIKVVK